MSVAGAQARPAPHTTGVRRFFGRLDESHAAGIGGADGFRLGAVGAWGVGRGASRLGRHGGFQCWELLGLSLSGERV